MKYKKKLKAFTVCLGLTPLFISAESLTIPHSFSPDTTIKSSEMNENFNSLVDSINTQEQTILTIESNLELNSTNLTEINSKLSNIQETLTSIDLKLSTQSTKKMVCSTPFNWLKGGTASYCLTKLEPTNVLTPTYEELAMDDWEIISVSGDAGGSNMFILSKDI